jgi:hypothetical protein
VIGSATLLPSHVGLLQLSFGETDTSHDSQQVLNYGLDIYPCSSESKNPYVNGKKCFVNIEGTPL